MTPIIKNGMVTPDINERVKMFEEIIFNDADGSDEDLRVYDYLGFRDHGPSKDWYDPIFFTSGNDWSTSIIYDNLKENIRYSVSINYEMMGNNEKHVSIHYGEAFNDSTSPPSKNITMTGSQYCMSYFVDYIDNEIVPSSADKFVKIIKKIIGLKVFL